MILRCIAVGVVAITGALASDRYRIETVAGGDNGGEGAIATEVQFLSIEGVAVDVLGNTYVSDAAGHRVRKVDPFGRITVVAGSGSAGFSGDGGPGAKARLNAPYGLAADPFGNLFIADYANGRVRRVSPSGTITTIAGGGITGVSGSGSDPLAVRLAGPRNLALDPAGNLYISDYEANAIYRLGVDGRLYLFAIGLNRPAGIAVDSTGALVIAESAARSVRRIFGAQSSILVSGLQTPTGVALDTRGNLYIADPGQGRVVMRSASGTLLAAGPSARDVATAPGGEVYFGGGTRVYRNSASGQLELFAGSEAVSAAGIQALGARIDTPIGLAVDAIGQIYIVEERAHRVRRVDLDGRLQITAGTGISGSAGDNGPAVQAQLNDPVAIALDPLGGMRIAEYEPGRVRGVSASGTAFTSIAPGPMRQPRGIAFDASGNLYIADSGNRRILRVARDGTETSLGLGAFHSPAAIAVDRTGDLYVADAGGNAIRRIRSNGAAETVAGTGMAGFAGDHGPAALAQLSGPTGIAIAPDGALWIADTFNHRVRRVDPQGIVRTVAGAGAAGYSGDGGDASRALLDTPAAIGIGPDGSVYIADLGNQRIRRLIPDASVGGVVQPPSPVVIPDPPAETRLEMTVLHAATRREQSVAPGQLISIINLPAGEIEWRIDRRPAVVVSASSSEIVALVPETAAGRLVIEGFRGADSVARRELDVAAAAPGLFATPDGEAIASLSGDPAGTKSKPAGRGSILTFFATGHGVNLSPVRFTVGSSPVDVLYAGLAPGLPGVCQINARMPGLFTAPGTYDAVLWIGDSPSLAGVTITLD